VRAQHRHTPIPTQIDIHTHRYRRKSSLSTKGIDIDESHRDRRKSSLPTKVIVIDESHRYPRKSSSSTKVIVIDASHRYRRVIVIDESSLSTQVIDTDESHRYRRKSSIPTAGGVESEAKLAELRYWGVWQGGSLALWCVGGVYGTLANYHPPSVLQIGKYFGHSLRGKFPLGNPTYGGFLYLTERTRQAARIQRPRAHQQRRVERTEDRLITRARERHNQAAANVCGPPRITLPHYT